MIIKWESNLRNIPGGLSFCFSKIEKLYFARSLLVKPYITENN
ncbi:hypothetical protein SAMN05518684_12269 [Salipaludibacillus aurantiacus]|uniref:Uncharacterized protein n=1 Tax=Salipaludibacillus aurantiacus TaxID=1601833 RepID=A0A1H9X0P6_9BACI|nr:hypothetical protein SAMN05518684_12269 [Salipaludibacillus aurantiacus]